MTQRLCLAAAFLISFVLTGPAEACLDRALNAFVASVEGRPVSAASLAGCRPPNLDLPPAGSGNWPILASAALYVAGAEDDRWLLPWLSGAGGQWGHNGRESGSTIYAGLNWAAALAVRHRACMRTDLELCDASGAWLRAGWAKWALAATSQAPSQIVYRQHDVVAERPRLDVLGYHGPFAHLVGDRQAEKPDRGRFMGSWVELTPLHPLLAWAADVPSRRYDESKIKAEERSLPLWVAKTLTGRSYGETMPIELTGLSAAERQTLRSFLTDPGDRQLATRLVRWLDSYPSLSRTVTYRRYQSGDVVAVSSHTTNANKSGAVVTAGLGSKSIWLLPSRFAGVGAATAQGQLLEDRAIATSNDGGRLELDLSALGEVAWEAVWDTEGARLLGEEVEPAPACALADLEDASATVACLRAEGSTPEELDGLFEPLGLILTLLKGYEDLPDDDRAAARERIAAAAEAIAAVARADEQLPPPP